MSDNSLNSDVDSQTMENLAKKIKAWGESLGFQQVAIVEPDLSQASEHLNKWLADGFQGSMDWMAEHGDMRYRVDKLVDHTLRVISVRMDYLADDKMIAVLKNDNKAYISRYALGRDYHKLIRKRLAQLVANIQSELPQLQLSQRPFVDSAPVMEKPLAEQAGLGWIGKNTLLLNDEAGSWFFLGEIYTSLPLPTDKSEQSNRCGNCRACLKICPTDAFPKPYVLDARKCISYLTIDLVTLFNWTEEQFLDHTQGSPIRRIGHERWLRNLAVGLGNASGNKDILRCLETRADDPSPLVREHVQWAIERQRNKLQAKPE